MHIETILSKSQSDMLLNFMKGKIKTDDKLLIFGCGYDSRFWEKYNSTFIESSKEWIEKINPSGEVIHHVYNHCAKDHQNIEVSNINLPDNIVNREWDIIFVDAPLGGYDSETNLSNSIGTGRMGSIYTAHLCIRENNVIIVDDYNRIIERTWADKYIKPYYKHNKVLTNHENKEVCVFYNNDNFI